ncbi:MAG: YCF48-related protein, partial [bacterium]
WTVGQYISYDIIYKTTNGGINWTSYTPGAGTNNNLNSIYFIDNNTGWTVGNDSTILKTTNGGINWANQTCGTSSYFYSVHFSNNNTGWIVGTNGSILKTENEGTNWIRQIIETDIRLYSVYFTDTNTGWTVGYNSTFNGTILKTVNGGTNWISQISGTSNLLFSVHFIDNNTGWTVGMGGTILKTTNGGTTAIQNISSEIPAQYELLQNYPNPFNPTTNINFSIPENSFVTLKVFDMQGKEIASLVNENLNAGSYNFDFNAANLTSGIYFYKLTTADFSDIKKMTLLK